MEGRREQSRRLSFVAREAGPTFRHASARGAREGARGYRPPREWIELVAKKGWAVERLAEAEISVHQWWWIPSGKNALGSTGVRHRQLVKAAIRVARGVLDQHQVDAADSTPRSRSRR